MAFELSTKLKIEAEQVAIALSQGRFQGHLGIAFNTVKEGAKVLHLATHKRLLVDPYPCDRCWIAAIVHLPPARSKQMVGIVRTVSKRLPQITYGLNFIASRGSFTASGEYHPPKGSDGLTCATFVSELFSAVALPLIKLETWEEREENVDWAKAVCEFLKEQGVDDRHIESVRKNINGLRVRPEEVAGAGGLFPADKRPVDYQSAFTAAIQAASALNSSCPRAVPPKAATLSLPPLTTPLIAEENVLAVGGVKAHANLSIQEPTSKAIEPTFPPESSQEGKFKTEPQRGTDQQ